MIHLFYYIYHRNVKVLEQNKKLDKIYANFFKNYLVRKFNILLIIKKLKRIKKSTFSFYLKHLKCCGQG
jgi:DNA-binding sugar fermentation-stimulating protein